MQEPVALDKTLEREKDDKSWHPHHLPYSFCLGIWQMRKTKQMKLWKSFLNYQATTAK
jgi:hypothetical protein